MKSVFPLVFFLLILVPGCGKNAPLKGKVTYEDGTPIKVGMVNFTTETHLSRGKIQSDGTYVVGTIKDKDGLPPGKYKVYITGAEESVESKQAQRLDSMGQPVQGMAAYRQLVGKEYMSADKTPLECEVPAKNNTYDISIKKPDYIK